MHSRPKTWFKTMMYGVGVGVLASVLTAMAISVAMLAAALS